MLISFKIEFIKYFYFVKKPSNLSHFHTLKHKQCRLIIFNKYVFIEYEVKPFDYVWKGKRIPTPICFAPSYSLSLSLSLLVLSSYSDLYVCACEWERVRERGRRRRRKEEWGVSVWFLLKHSACKCLNTYLWNCFKLEYSVIFIICLSVHP